MNLQNRTREYQTATSTWNYGDQGEHDMGEYLISREKPSRKPNEFISKAIEVETTVHRLSEKLQTLSKLLRSGTSDSYQQIEDISVWAKNQLDAMKAITMNLENFQKGTRHLGYSIGVPASQTMHSHRDQLVMSLKMKIMDASILLKTLLEERSRNLKTQQRRREQFSAVNTSQLSSFSGRAQTSHGGRADHIAVDMGQTTQGPDLQQLQSLAHKSDNLYLESRSTALQGIEATINELGTIYQQLASLVSEQADTVQRIDTNIEQMGLNIERGQYELLRYLRSVSSNRWLLVKIFAMLIIFIVFWSIFFL